MDQNKKYPIEKIKNDLYLLLNNLDLKTNEFSYLPYLKSIKSRKNKFKFKNLSILDSLLKLKNDVKTNPNIISKYVIKRYKRQNQSELFKGCLEFVKNEKYKNDFYYWYPNVRITNIFSLIKEILPNFIDLYRGFIVKGDEINDNVMNFINDKYPDSIERFSGIQNDHERFKGIKTVKNVKNTNLGCPSLPSYINNKLNKYKSLYCKTSKIKPVSILITPSYWIDDYETFFDNKEVITLGNNLECALASEVSFVEIVYNKKEMKIPYNIYLGLIQKSNDAEQYLVRAFNNS